MSSEMSEQEKIDRRLLNQMSKAEQEAFDQELTRNSDLADSFDFNQNMSDFFRNENPDLEGKLDELGNKYFSDAPTKNKSRVWLWLILLSLLAVCALFYFTFKTDKTIEITTSIVKPELETEIPNAPNTSQNTKEKTEEIVVPVEQKESDEEQIEIEKTDFYSPPNTDNAAPIAALNPEDFKVNPVMETLLRENVRDHNVTTIKEPLNNAVLDVSSDLFTFSGFSNVNPPYQLSIYTNREFDFNNDYPVLRQKVSGRKSGDKYSFNFQAKTTFKTGLYYLFLTDSKSNLIAISKFSVK